MSVEHRTLPLGGAHRRLQLSEHHPTDALAAGCRRHQNRHLAAGVGRPRPADADHLALAASRQDDRPVPWTRPWSGELSRGDVGRDRRQQALHLRIEQAPPGDLHRQPASADHGRRTEGGVGEGLPDPARALLQEGHALHRGHDRKAVEGRQGGGNPGLARGLGQGHVRHPRPGQRAQQGRDEDGGAQGPQSVEITSDVQVEDWIVGQESRRRPQGELQRAGLAGGRGSKGGQGGRELVGADVDRRNQRQMGRHPSDGRIAEGPAQAVHRRRPPAARTGERRRAGAGRRSWRHRPRDDAASCHTGSLRQVAHCGSVCQPPRF